MTQTIKSIQETVLSLFEGDSYRYDPDKYNKTYSDLVKKAENSMNNLIEFIARVNFESQNRELKSKNPLKFEDFENYNLKLSEIIISETVEAILKSSDVVKKENESMLNEARTDFLLNEAEEIIENYEKSIDIEE